MPRHGYPEAARTIGEHVRRKRMDQGRLQRDLAAALGVSKGEPRQLGDGPGGARARWLPAIIRYLGYDPRPRAALFGDRIRAAREADGLSQRELAAQLQIDPGTVTRWERGELMKPYLSVQRMFEEYVDSTKEP